MRIIGYFMLGVLPVAEVFVPSAGWTGSKLSALGNWLDETRYRLDNARLRLDILSVLDD